MGAMVVAVGAAVLLTGCGSSSDNSQPTPSNAQATAAAATSAGATNPSTGGGNNEGENVPPAPAPAQQPAPEAPAPAPAQQPAPPVAPAPPAQQPAPAAQWDPCGINLAAVAKQGFNTSATQVVDNSDDKSCRWPSTSGKSELTIVSTHKTIQDFIQSGRYVNVNPVPVGDRAGYQYRAAQDTNKIGCYVSVTVPGGLVSFITRNLRPDAPEEPCVAARRISAGLVGLLP